MTTDEGLAQIHEVLLRIASSLETIAQAQAARTELTEIVEFSPNSPGADKTVSQVVMNVGTTYHEFTYRLVSSSRRITREEAEEIKARNRAAKDSASVPGSQKKKTEG